jgi:hypothetical protein
MDRISQSRELDETSIGKPNANAGGPMPRLQITVMLEVALVFIRVAGELARRIFRWEYGEQASRLHGERHPGAPPVSARTFANLHG